MLFFAVTSVTPKKEIGGKEGRNFAKCRRTKRDFCWHVKRNLKTRIVLLLKIAQTNTQATEKELFTDTAVTLVTAKRQKLLECAYARTRERV